MKILFLFLVLLVAGCIHSFAFDIVKAGKPCATVVIDKDADYATNYAKDEFVKYIEQISKVRLDVSNIPGDGNNIYIGQSDFVKSVLGAKDFDYLKTDGIQIYIKDNDMVLVGDSGAGTIYAVYTFLEDFLGVKYLSPEIEYIPNLKDISIENTDYKYTPPFFSRECHYKLNYVVPYSLKMKQNGWMNMIPDNLGGHVYSYGGAHTFNLLINPDVYGQDHPEWFSEIDRKRKVDKESQLCLSNDEMVEELTKNVLNVFREHPELKIVSCTQNDNSNYCRCAKCSSLAEKYGQSGILLLALNKVAKAVKEEFPDKYIDTFAYWYTKEAPLGDVVPEDNIIIRLCSIEADFSKDFNDPSNKDVKQNLEDWSKLSKTLFFWNYIVNFSNYEILHPNFHTLQPNLKLMRDHNVVGVFEQGDYYNDNACLGMYKRYIDTKMTWDPDIDVEKETNVFMKYYYGPAEKDMKAFLDYVNEIMPKVQTRIRTFMQSNDYFTAKDWITCFKYLNNAMKKTKGTKYYDRVKFDYVSFYAGYILAEREVATEVEKAKVVMYKGANEGLNEINTFLPEHGVYHFQESKKWEDGLYASALPTKKEGEKPIICQGLKDNQWIELQENEITIHLKDDKYAKIVDDPKASNGKALWLNAKYKDWYIQRSLASMFYDKTINDVDVYLEYRSEGEKCPYVFGLYNSTQKEFLTTFLTPQSGYNIVKIGNMDMQTTSPATLFYFCGLGVDDPNINMYVDRIIFVLNK